MPLPFYIARENTVYIQPGISQRLFVGWKAIRTCWFNTVVIMIYLCGYLNTFLVIKLQLQRHFLELNDGTHQFNHGAVPSLNILGRSLLIWYFMLHFDTTIVSNTFYVTIFLVENIKCSDIEMIFMLLNTNIWFSDIENYYY